MRIPAGKFRSLGPIAAALILLSSAVALGDEVADMALEAENLLQSDEPATAFDAMDAAVDAFWRTAPLIIEDAHFDPEGDSAVFKSTDRVGIHVRPLGYGFETGGDTNRIVLDADIEIRTPGGLVLAQSDDFGRLEWAGPGKNRNFTGRISIEMPDLAAGDYELVLTLNDQATQKTASVVLPFAISRQ